ncbi:hypothetical protein OSL60_29040, partial [Escherichia coli]|nr:hypothetical protein [Escherichia coli]
SINPNGAIENAAGAGNKGAKKSAPRKRRIFKRRRLVLHRNRDVDQVLVICATRNIRGVVHIPVIGGQSDEFIRQIGKT